MKDDSLGPILHRMGQTADEVAATLRAHHIQGVRNTVRFFNPVVRYAQQELRVDVSALDVMQPNMLRMIVPDREEQACLPEPVKDFLDAFNRGAYPELELPAEGT